MAGDQRMAATVAALLPLWTLDTDRLDQVRAAAVDQDGATEGEGLRLRAPGTVRLDSGTTLPAGTAHSADRDPGNG